MSQGLFSFKVGNMQLDTRYLLLINQIKLMKRLQLKQINKNWFQGNRQSSFTYRCLQIAVVLSQCLLNNHLVNSSNVLFIIQSYTLLYENYSNITNCATIHGLVIPATLSYLLLLISLQLYLQHPQKPNKTKITSNYKSSLKILSTTCPLFDN